MIQKKSLQNAFISIIIFTLLFNSYSTIQFPNDVHAASDAKTETIYFDQSTNHNQSQTINIPFLEEVIDVEIDTGSVNYSVNGYEITIETSNGDAVGTETYYNPYKYSKTATAYRTSSSTVFSSTYSYSDANGYSGTLTKDGSSYWYSGEFIPSDSKTVSDSCTNTVTAYYNSEGKHRGETESNPCPGSISYNSGGYSGTLSRTGYSGGGGCGFWGPPNGTCSQTFTAFYSGVVTRPAIDTRVYRQDYKGTVYKGGNSTRNLYAYEVTITYTTDTTPPNGNVIADVTDFTNQNVTLTANGTDVGVAGMERIKKPDGTYTNGSTATYTVTENGTYTFEFEDQAGNISTESIDITNIDKENPSGILTPSTSAPTNQDVVITAIGSDTGVSGFKQITDPDGNIISGDEATYTVSGNGTYTFEFEDAAGNKISKDITISNIDKTAPTGTLTPSTTEVTSGNVIIDIAGADAGTSGFKGIKHPDGTYVHSDTSSYLVEEDGTYAFEFEDHAGNITIESITISNIDKEGPIGNLSLDTEEPTNQNVTIYADGEDVEAGMKGIYHPNDTFVTGEQTTYEVTENGHYTFVFEDKVGNKTSQTISVSNIDKIKPDGILTASTTSPTNETVMITAEGIDSESGIKQITLPDDSVVNEETAEFEVSSNGTYSFVFEDNAGNRTTKSISIDNIDLVEPTLYYTVSTTEPTNQNVTISIEANDDASGIKGIQLPDGSIVFQDSVEYEAEVNGDYTFVAIDNAGNEKSIPVSITNIDKEGPETTVTLSPSTYTKDNVEITLKATDINGIISITAPNGAKTKVSATPYLDTSYRVVENGTYTFIIEDGLGNIRTKDVVVSNIDKEKPTLQLTPSTTEPTNEDITITIEANDDVGVESITLPDDIIVNDDNATFIVEENGVYNFTVKDVAGNTETQHIEITNIDKTSPLIEIIPNTTNPTNQAVTLRLVASDDNSGVSFIEGPNGEKTTESEWEYIVSQNGVYTFQVGDKAGNTTTKTITIENIDTIGPNVYLTPSIMEPTNQNITIKVEANDEEFGIQSIQTPNKEIKTEASFEYEVSENGEYTFIATDEAGNETTQTITISNIDKKTPSLTLTLSEEGPTNQDITITATGEDNESGVAFILLPDEQTIHADTTHFIATENGTYSFKVVDKAGNETIQEIQIETIDKTPPTLELSANVTEWTNQSIQIAAKAKDEESGIESITNPNEEVALSDNIVFVAEENGEYIFRATDNAGNVVVESITIDNIDKQNPVIFLETNSNELTAEPVDILYQISDDVSGMKEVTLPDGSMTVDTSGFYTITENGDYTFTAEDNAGNKIEETISIHHIDTEGPVIMINGDFNSITNEDIVVNVEVTDNLSGVQNIVTPDGEIDESVFEYVISENGIYTFEATDNLGNITKKTIEITTIDKEAPKLTVSLKNDQLTNKETVILVEAKDEGFGLKHITNPDNTKQEDEFIYTYSVNQNGDYVFLAEDIAGNVTTKTISVSNIDVENPVITITKDNKASTDKKHIYHVKVADSSGIKSVILPDGKEAQKEDIMLSFTKSGVYVVKAEDNAGNIAQEKIEIIIPKTEKPKNDNSNKKDEDKKTVPKPITNKDSKENTEATNKEKEDTTNENNEAELPPINQHTEQPKQHPKPEEITYSLPDFDEKLAKEYEENTKLVLGDKKVSESEIQEVVNKVIDITNQLQEVKRDKSLDSLQKLYDKIYEEQNKAYERILEKEYDLIKEVITKETKISSNFLSLHRPYIGENLNALALARESFPTIIQENESLDGELELKKLIDEINEDYELSVYIQRIGQTEVATSDETKVLGTNSSGPDFTWVKVYGNVIDFTGKEKVLQTVSGVTVGLTGNYKLLAQVVDKEENVVFEFTKNFLVDSLKDSPNQEFTQLTISPNDTDNGITILIYSFVFATMLFAFLILIRVFKKKKQKETKENEEPIPS